MFGNMSCCKLQKLGREDNGQPFEKTSKNCKTLKVIILPEQQENSLVTFQSAENIPILLLWGIPNPSLSLVGQLPSSLI